MTARDKWDEVVNDLELQRAEAMGILMSLDNNKHIPEFCKPIVDDLMARHKASSAIRDVVATEMLAELAK